MTTLERDCKSSVNRSVSQLYSHKSRSIQNICQLIVKTNLEVITLDNALLPVACFPHRQQLETGRNVRLKIRQEIVKTKD